MAHYFFYFLTFFLALLFSFLYHNEKKIILQTVNYSAYYVNPAQSLTINLPHAQMCNFQFRVLNSSSKLKWQFTSEHPSRIQFDIHNMTQQFVSSVRNDTKSCRSDGTDMFGATNIDF